MNPGDPIIWTDPETGREYAGKYIASYSGRAIIETVTPSGHLGLRYVNPNHLRRADSAGEKHG